MFYSYESDKWEVIMPKIYFYAILIFILYFFGFILNLGYKHYILMLLTITISWFAYAKFLGLKGKETLYALDFLAKPLQTLISLLMWILCVGFMCNFFEIKRDKWLIPTTLINWGAFITGTLLLIIIFVIIGYLRKVHKPQKLIEHEKEEKLEKLVDDFVEKHKDDTILEIDKLRAENEALKKKLQENSENNND